MKLFGIISEGFDVTDQLLTRVSAFVRYRKKNGNTIRRYIDFKNAYNLVRKELLCTIVIEFGVPMELVRLIKMCLNETFIKVRIGKYLSDTFPIQNGLKQGDALSPLLFNCSLEYAVG
jgi:hypothetical protein